MGSRPSNVLSIPEFGVRLAFEWPARATFRQRVSPALLKEAGYQFSEATLEVRCARLSPRAITEDTVFRFRHSFRQRICSPTPRAQKYLYKRKVSRALVLWMPNRAVWLKMKSQCH